MRFYTIASLAFTLSLFFILPTEAASCGGRGQPQCAKAKLSFGEPHNTAKKEPQKKAELPKVEASKGKPQINTNGKPLINTNNNGNGLVAQGGGNIVGQGGGNLSSPGIR